MQNYSYALYPDELYHYGVKDMHWGVRNYQNKDGSLTALGRIHYGIEGMYNGPKMEHLKSQVARGWATANDPEFLGRKMSDVYQKVGRAAELTKRKDFWNHDLNTIVPYIQNWMSPAQYNVSDVSGATTADYNKSPNADVTIDWSGAKVGGYANKVIRTDSPTTSYVDPDKLEFGNMLINVYQGYQDAKNVKMSELADYSVNRKIIKSTESVSPLGIKTADELTVVNRPVDTTIETISMDPHAVESAKNAYLHRVMTGVDDTLERDLRKKVQKRADEIFQNPTVTKEEQTKNKKALEKLMNAHGMLTYEQKEQKKAYMKEHPSEANKILSELTAFPTFKSPQEAAKVLSEINAISYNTRTMDDLYEWLKRDSSVLKESYLDQALRRDIKIKELKEEMDALDWENIYAHLQ
jgi:hypothetical protein